MSRRASRYVKHLVKAPDGSKITPTEKAILYQLADYHREESGCAYPSMRELARCSCVNERHCRRLISGLEARGVLLRIETMRRNHGGQSSNLYVFKELDSPEKAKQLTESDLNSFKIPRRLKSGRVGHHPPGLADAEDPKGRTERAGSPGRGSPPIEPLSEHSDDSNLNTYIELSPISPSQVRRELDMQQSSRILFAAAVAVVHGALMNPRPENVEMREGFCDGAVDWRKFHFGDMALESLQKKPDGGLVLTVSTPDLTTTGRGLTKYKSRWDVALRKAFGQAVSLQLCPRASRILLSTAHERSVQPRNEDLVPLSSVIEMWHSKRKGVGGENL